VGSIEKEDLLNKAQADAQIGYNTLRRTLQRMLDADDVKVFQRPEKRANARPKLRITRERWVGCIAMWRG
jgi:outer membrane lipopolysaccharide assembly protein LptE/RlpB